jgi:hypothetical protein
MGVPAILLLRCGRTDKVMGGHPGVIGACTSRAGRGTAANCRTLAQKASVGARPVDDTFPVCLVPQVGVHQPDSVLAR